MAQSERGIISGPEGPLHLRSTVVSGPQGERYWVSTVRYAPLLPGGKPAFETSIFALPPSVRLVERDGQIVFSSIGFVEDPASKEVPEISGVQGQTDNVRTAARSHTRAVRELGRAV
jgi:hypothetical protein